MRFTALRTACIAALLLAAAPRADALEIGADLDLGVARMSGDTTYRIGGRVADATGSDHVQWPLSELAWPLDVTLVTLAGGLRVGEDWSANVSLASNLGKGTGTMEDSDWGVYWLEFGPPFRSDSLDVFSTSDAEFDALTADAVVRRRVFTVRGLAVSAGLGYLHERFDYSAANVEQYSPSFPDYAPQLREEGVFRDRYRYSGAETGITYEVSWRVPYAELSGAYAIGDALTVDARLAFSPFVTAVDRDDHLLRGKLNEGECEGSGVILGLHAHYAFAGGWFAGAGVDYRRFETSGTQTQTWYRTEDPDDPLSPRAGDRATIDLEVTSSQLVGRFEIGYGF